MKTKLPILLVSLFLFISCGKDTAEDIVDCMGQSLFSSVHHTFSTSDAREITFSVTHSDEPKIKSVDWNFGDGNSQKVNSESISHTYSAAGTFEVKATIHLSNSCSFDKSKSITIE